MCLKQGAKATLENYNKLDLQYIQQFKITLTIQTFSLKYRIFLLLAVTLTALLSACNTTKYLAPDEAFLVSNTIVLEKKPKIKERNALLYELSTLYKQKPNGNMFNLPWISKRWFWYRNQGPADTTRYDRFVLKNFAEKPAIFDDQKAYETAETMEYYLQNRGWFNAEVYHTKDIKGKKGQQAQVTYYVVPNERYLVDSVDFMSKDPTVERTLDRIGYETYLPPGAPVDNRLYEQEKTRISKHLRNTGYYAFSPRYVAPLTGDSLNHRVKIDLEVLLPNEEEKHRKYTLGRINVFPQLIFSDTASVFRDTVVGGVKFTLPVGEEFFVKPRTLLRNIFMEEGTLFSQNDKDRTLAALGKLGVYKIINVVEVPSVASDTVLNVDIQLTPRNPLEFGADGEINTSGTNSTLVGRRFFGAGVGLSVKDRNLLGGAELLVINSDLNFDFDVSEFNDPDSLVNTLDFKIQTDLYLPKFVDYLGFWGGLYKMNWLNESFYNRLREKSSTRISFSYNFVDRFRLYQLNSLNVSYGYEIPQTKKQRYELTHFGLNYLRPFIQPAFQEILDDAPFFARSFEQQLFTGFLLRNFEYTYFSPVSRRGESFVLNGNFELSGAEILAANSIYNGFAEVDKVFEISGSRGTTAFSQYTVLEGDLRFYRAVSQEQQFAFRFYTGIGIPFGNSTDVPYVKQFSVGGPYSIRAWRARELGPGGYIDPLTQGANPNALLFYQTGNFKIEANAEYRFLMFDLFGFKWDGAFFADIGNIYTLKNDPERPLSKLAWSPEFQTLPDGRIIKIQDNFINQLAVGSGFGIRADFLYFIFRLDFGVPLRNPYPTTIFRDGMPTEDVFYWRNLREMRLRDLTINIDLGYPF